MADDARFLRAQIARIRRLLFTSVNDAETERALNQLAQEYEARADQAERRREGAAEPTRSDGATLPFRIAMQNGEAR